MPANDPVKNDALLICNFTIKIDGVTDAHFREVSGIGSETEVVEHRVMGSKGAEAYMLPGRLKWGDLTLKRGITGTMDFWKWFSEIEKGNIEKERRAVTISGYDRAMKNVVAEWVCHAAWVSKISGPGLKSGGGDVGIEEMVLVHEGIERTK